MTDHEDTTDDSTADSLDTRGRIEKSLEGILSKEALDALLLDVLAIKKQSRGWCGTCKKAVQVEIPDAKAVVSAMSELLVHASGRPGTETPDDQQTTVNIFYVTGGDGPEQVSHNGVVVDDPREAARLLAEARNGAN